MVYSQLLQDRRLQVVHVDGILGDVVAKFIRRAVRRARPDAAASQPYRETARVMVASVVVFGELAL